MLAERRDLTVDRIDARLDALRQQLAEAVAGGYDQIEQSLRHRIDRILDARNNETRA